MSLNAYFDNFAPYKYQASQHSLMQMGNVRLGTVTAIWPYERFVYSLQNISTVVSTYAVETNIVANDYVITTIDRNDPERKLYKCEVQLHTLYNMGVGSDIQTKDVELNCSYGAYNASGERVNYLTSFKSGGRTFIPSSLLVVFSTIQNQR